MTGFDKPNYTMTPNMLFDEIMRDMSEAELKVTLAIVRQTFGYHKRSDPISLTQLEKMTGLSRTACVTGVDAVIERGLVTRSIGSRNISIFELVVNDDQLKEATSSSSNLLPVTSSKKLHTKERDKEKKENRVPALHQYIKTWATARGIDETNIGAPIHTSKDTACAKRMAKWSITPTQEEIATAINTSKRKNDYAFTWLEKDITELRLQRSQTLPPALLAPPSPQEAPSQLTPEQKAARHAEYERIMKEMTDAIVMPTVRVA